MSTDSTTTKSTRHAWWPLVVVLLVTLVIRVGALVAMHQRLNDDPDAYRQIAQGLLRSGVYTCDIELDSSEVPGEISPSAYRPPLYPLLLTKLARGNHVPPLAIGVLQVVLGLLTVALTYRLAWEWQLGAWSSLAALLVALDPILINQAVLVMTETLATLLAVVCLWQLTRFSERPSLWNALWSGAMLGLAVLCRPTFLPWAGLIGLVMLTQRARPSGRLLRIATFASGVLLLLAPWMVRNQSVLHSPIATTTHGGYTLFLANNPGFYEYLRSGDQAVAWGPARREMRGYRDRLPPEVSARLEQRFGSLSGAKQFVSLPDELVIDIQYNELARWSIWQDPGMFAYSCLVRTYYLWSPLPQKTTKLESTYRALARYLTALWYLGVYLLAIGGVCKLRWQTLCTPWIWGITLCLTFTLLHAVYFSNLRMRAPLMPVVALLATAALVPKSAFARQETGN